MAARVMVFAKINRADADAFEAAYAQVTANVKGTAGHIGDELLRRREPPDAEDQPLSYILLSEWESKDAFLAWEESVAHVAKRSPMHPYWAGKVERIIFDVAHTIKSTI
jgi:heme oxygenase (mycobilin-producing)